MPWACTVDKNFDEPPIKSKGFFKNAYSHRENIAKLVFI